MSFARLLALFIIIPVIELSLFLTLGKYVGIPGTLALIVATALLGASLTRWQGMKTMQRFQERLGQGQIPGGEVISGVLILVAGALLLTPGFLTDFLGFSLLIPPVRTVIGQFVMKTYAKSLGVDLDQVTGKPRSAPGTQRRPGPDGMIAAKGRVIETEVVVTPDKADDKKSN